MKEEAHTRLRCRPGDLARIKTSWNSLLVGRIAFVRSAYSETEWVIALLGEPALVPNPDGTRIIAARLIIADDWALEPLTSVSRGASAPGLIYSTAPRALPRQGEVAKCI